MELINQSILKILIIINCKFVISIMLIIPEDIHFKHVSANNVKYGSDRKHFNHQMGGVSCILLVHRNVLPPKRDYLRLLPVLCPYLALLRIILLSFIYGIEMLKRDRED